MTSLRQPFPSRMYIFVPVTFGATVIITSTAGSSMHIGSMGVLITYTFIVTPKPSSRRGLLASLLSGLAHAQAVCLTLGVYVCLNHRSLG